MRPVRHLLSVRNYCRVPEFAKVELDRKESWMSLWVAQPLQGGKVECHLKHEKVTNSGLKERSISLGPHHGDK